MTVQSEAINFSESGTLFFSHMWYMPMIIGMYLSMPFVSAALKQFDRDTIFKASIVFSLLAFALPFITIVCEMHGINGVALQYCLGFSGGVYGIYMILGYLVKKGQFKNISSSKLWIIMIISFLICVIFQYYAFTKNYDFRLWYEFPFVMLGSFALFELCSRMGKVPGYRIITFLSKYSFAVFLIHNLFRLPFLPFIVLLLPYSEPVKAIILWILLIIFSYAAAVIIYRIPKFGKYILYMR